MSRDPFMQLRALCLGPALFSAWACLPATTSDLEPVETRTSAPAAAPEETTEISVALTAVPSGVQYL
jgi:hypothetical protein